MTDTPAGAAPPFDDGLVRAAGGVVTRPGAGGETEVLVVHRPRYGDWSIPKGKLDPGETFEDGARREVEEETGCRCTLHDELPAVRYVDRHGRPKVVRYWHMTVAEEREFVPDREVDEIRWLPAGTAVTLLSYGADRALVEHVVNPRP